MVSQPCWNRGRAPVSEAEQPVMHRIVRELAAAAGQPMPRLYVSPSRPPAPGATQWWYVGAITGCKPSCAGAASASSAAYPRLGRGHANVDGSARCRGEQMRAG
jgi:Zn-dependent protease with chaperone function